VALCLVLLADIREAASRQTEVSRTPVITRTKFAIQRIWSEKSFIHWLLGWQATLSYVSSAIEDRKRISEYKICIAMQLYQTDTEGVSV
jgi:hypothetical protein